MPSLFGGSGRLHIGYNASYRSGEKTDDNLSNGNPAGRGYDADMFSSRNTTAVNRLKFLNTGQFPGVKYDFLQGAELGGYKDGFRINGEVITDASVMNKNTAGIPNYNTKKFWGYYVQAAYLLFGGKQQYDVSQSEFTQPTRGKKWGDIEVMARFDYLNLNSQGIYGGSGQNIALGVVYHINNNVKIMVNYQISQNDKYANGNGKFTVGKDINGNYTTDPKLAASDFGARFNALQTRIELDF